MSGSRVEGLAAAHSLLGAMPQAAREQIGVELAIIARDVLAAQKRDVPKDTGQAQGALTLHLMLDRLRVRVGLLNVKGGRAKLFYGRIVEFGRKAQTVLVQRRRRVNGRLRTERNRKRASDIVSTYSLKVKARAPVPFVRKDRPEVDVAQRLANFWGDTIRRAEGAA